MPIYYSVNAYRCKCSNELFSTPEQAEAQDKKILANFIGAHRSERILEWLNGDLSDEVADLVALFADMVREARAMRRLDETPIDARQEKAA